MFSYTVLHKSGQCNARWGIFETPHGSFNTPAFMPVGTQGSVKAISPDRLSELGAEIVLSNTYHLYLRPGHEAVRSLGGLHRFMGFLGPILTDSGGFQIYSLGELRKISEEGVTFASHIDGTKHLITPEFAIAIQESLGADIIMSFDECTPYPSSFEDTKSSMELTLRWARRCREAKTREDQALFGIVQGGMYKELRGYSAESTVALDFPGHAIGGLSVGEAKGLMYEIAEYTLSLLPEDKPRYIMGVGTPEDLVNLSAAGADMFDCVMPTRNARNGTLFTSRGKVVMRNEKHKLDQVPIDDACGCYACRNFSRGYIRHLFMAGEMLAAMLGTLHNLSFYLELMKKIREAIKNDELLSFRQRFLNTYEGEM